MGKGAGERVFSSGSCARLLKDEYTCGRGNLWLLDCGLVSRQRQAGAIPLRAGRDFVNMSVTGFLSAR
jgi:hypothetical protein